MDQFERDTLTKLGRIEEAIKHLVDRISQHENLCRAEDTLIWQELRRQSEDIAKKLETKLVEIRIEASENAENYRETVSGRIDEIQETIREWEDRIFSVERGISASETTSKNITSIEDKVDRSAKQITDLSIKVEHIATQIEGINQTIGEMKGDKRHTLATILTIIALLIAAASFLFNSWTNISKNFVPAKSAVVDSEK